MLRLVGFFSIIVFAYIAHVILIGKSELEKRNKLAELPAVVLLPEEVIDGVGLLWKTAEGEALCFQVDGWEGREGREAGGGVVLYMAGLMGSRLESFRQEEGEGTWGKKLLITIDRPGLGCTPSWGESSQTRYIRVSDAVLDLVEGLGLGRKGVEVVGWSSGGPFALAVAASAKERGVVINSVKTVASDPQWARARWSTLVALPSHLALYGVVKLKVPKQVVGSGALFVVELLQGLEAALGLISLEEINRNFGESMMRNGTASGFAVAEEMRLERDLDYGFMLEDIENVEVTIYHSRGDRLVPFTASEELASRIPGAQVVELPPNGFRLFEEGHMIMEKFWDLIVEQ